MDVNISLQTDSDGFLSQECPACRKRFKAVFGDDSDKPISYCPYCAHHEQDCWWTDEQAEYLSAVVAKKAVVPELNKMARDFNHKTRGNLLGMKLDIKADPVPPSPYEPDDAMEICSFDCCGERIKHDGSSGQRHCVICGTPSA